MIQWKEIACMHGTESGVLMLKSNNLRTRSSTEAAWEVMLKKVWKGLHFRVILIETAYLYMFPGESLQKNTECFFNWTIERAEAEVETEHNPFDDDDFFPLPSRVLA